MVGVLGEVLVTAGVIVVLFLVWQLWWAPMQDAKVHTAVALAIEEEYRAFVPTASVPVPTGPVEPGTVHQAPPEGDVFALMRVPRFGSDWVRPIYEGVTLPVLTRGVGHYPNTQLPAEIGNLAVAAHRLTYGNPFVDIDKIQPDDVVVVETREAYVVYRVQRHAIVPPTALEVIAPVPEQPGAVPTEAWLTMTSCHPMFSNATRYVVFAKLEHVYSRADGLPAQLLDPPSA